MKVTKELVDYLASKADVKQRELIEKDAYLHLLLKELNSDDHFRNNYVFKGGTCLIKCYIGYYRFSEDLDFSYIRQEDFKDKSEKKIRKQLSEEIGEFTRKLERITDRIGIDFKAHKEDPHYIEFGGSNKFVTFKLWYTSIELKTTQFIKIQVNYVEKFNYAFKTVEAKNILTGIDAKEFRFLYPEAAETLLKNPKVKAYDIREILAEKVRAILTRQGIKTRDYVDIYMIQEHTEFKPDEMKNTILEKTEFMLRYEKYQRNLLKKVEEEPKYRPGEEERLMIKPLDKYFPHKTKKLEKLIHELANQLV